MAEKLFVPYSVDREGDLSVHSTYKCIAKAIKRAQEWSNTESLGQAHVQAHQVRALSTFWAHFNKTSFKEMMKVTVWRSNSSFVGFG